MEKRGVRRFAFFYFCPVFYTRIQGNISKILNRKGGGNGKGNRKEKLEYLIHHNDKVDEYWNKILFSLTDDDLKFKITEINELERMDVVRFFQYYTIFEEQLEQKINRMNNG